jgi:predicted glutamine amidotransferase
MCIIAVKPEKIQFTKQQCKIMWRANPHGAGLMYATGKRVEIVKGLMTFDDFWSAYNEAGPLRKMVIHFRIKTHGDVNPENTHPFWVVKNKFALVHNGVIRPLINETSAMESDTAVFARKLGENYADPMYALTSPFIRETFESYIGYSKVVFMNAKGETTILNEKMGTWHKNVWYSNDSFKEEKPKAAMTSQFKSELEAIMKSSGTSVTSGETYKPRPPITVPSKLVQAPEHFAPSAKPTPPPRPKSQKPTTVFRAEDFLTEDLELAEAMQNWEKN